VAENLDPIPEWSAEPLMANIPETLSGSTVVITGATSGFGRGVALALAQEGANVVLAARRSGVLESLEKEIASQGGEALAVVTDVGSAGDVERLCQQSVQHYGRIDVWINNVGVGALGFFWDIPTDVHARLVEVNLNGLIYGCHAALRQFLSQDGGTLINVGSVDSEVPLALQNTYAATKAAVLSLSRSLNEELRLSENSDRIRVATIMPWAVDTPWWIHAANYTGHAPRMAAMDDPELVIYAIAKHALSPKRKCRWEPRRTLRPLATKSFPTSPSASLRTSLPRKGTRPGQRRSLTDRFLSR
jgi:short-subunit dehydrogenase